MAVAALVLLLLGLVLPSSGFNVDTTVPVVKQAGVQDGMFGFSVSLHQQSEGEKRYLLLAGAPQDAAPYGVGVNRTGALYACPVTMLKTDCFRVPIDQQSLPGRNVIENMWLGVTVESMRPAGRVLVCGHRYTSVQVSAGTSPREEHYRMIGKCYVRGNDLQYNNMDEWQTYHNEMCNVNTDLDNTGMCQMGISGGFNKNMLYFGAPGAFTWQGTDFILQRVTSDFGIDDTVDISSPKVDSLKNIYLGYSVKLGTGILHQDVTTVVSGAPRYQHKGAVFIFDIDIPSMKERQILNGDQVGSYFGSVIALADFNNDGWQEIVVGAPYYFDRKEDVGGAVYIYTNEVGSFTDKPSSVLYGPTGSAFGFAVANVGDINQDGFTDLAVGAPFEDMGKVYIYHSKSSGLQSKPSQVIDGSQIGGIPTFGYSISGGLDVDDNSYPDLLVGSLADQIALLRSRPVINISKEFSVTPTLVDPSKCSATSCMEVRFCFSYLLSTGNPKYKKNITLQYTVEGDFDKRPARVRFWNTTSAIYKGYFSMPETKCQTLKLLLQESIRDKLHPIHISLKYSLLPRDMKARSNVVSLDNFPVLNEDQSTEQTLEVDFQKECGTDNVCRSNLQMQYEYLTENLEPLPRINGSQVLHYDSSVLNVYLKLRVTVTNFQTSTSPADDAHGAMLNITTPEELHFSKAEPACDIEGTIICDLGNPFRRNQKAEIIITFQASRIALKTREVTTGLQLSTLSKQSDLVEQHADFLVDYTIQTSFSVVPVHLQTYFSGKVVGESAMKSASDVGSPVEFTFMVSNNKDSLDDLGSLILAVDWPHEVANGKWLLYPTEVTVKTDNVTHCQPPGDVINPLNLTLSGNRRRRDIGEQIPVQTLAATKPEKPNTLLKCRAGANCVRFECPLNNMTTFANITVRGRVWNGTFLEDYRLVDRVWVEGSAELLLRTDIPSINMKRHHVLFSVAIDSEVVELPPAELPLWVIIVSVGSGILLLGIIILLLWKCGFFRRANTRAKYEVRGQKAEMKLQPSETERLTQDS